MNPLIDIIVACFILIYGLHFGVVTQLNLDDYCEQKYGYNVNARYLSTLFQNPQCYKDGNPPKIINIDKNDFDNYQKQIVKNNTPIEIRDNDAYTESQRKEE